MEHPFFATSSTTNTRAEALRWLSIAEKLLSGRDLTGSKSFATRARDSDPTLKEADEVLAVAETLIAGDRRVGSANHLRDWYAVLHLTPLQGRDSGSIATQYGNLIRFLNPNKNKYPFADEAFRLVLDAWTVLQNPASKATYDREIGSQFQQQQRREQTGLFGGDPNLQQNFMFFGGNAGAAGGHHGVGQAQPQMVDNPVASGSGQIGSGYAPFSSSGSRSGYDAGSSSQMNYPNFGGNVGEQWTNSNIGNTDNSENVRASRDNLEERRNAGVPGNNDRPTMWTACPYCYYIYEYDREYVDCVLRCQNCKSAFEAVEVSKPPLSCVNGEKGYFYSWGCFPLGYTAEYSEINRGGVSGWTPFSPMFALSQVGSNVGKKDVRRKKSQGPKVFVDDDEVYVQLSGSSESGDDWTADKDKKKKSKTQNTSRGKGTSGTPNRRAQQSLVDENMNVEDRFVSSNKTEMPNRTMANVQEQLIRPNKDQMHSGPTVNTQECLVSPMSYGITENAQGSLQSANGVAISRRTMGEPCRVEAMASSRMPPVGALNKLGRLDLNVELNNETEEPALRVVDHGHGPIRRGDDTIEGIGFFEGLDEFLSNLPILNVVRSDRVFRAP